VPFFQALSITASFKSVHQAIRAGRNKAAEMSSKLRASVPFTAANTPAIQRWATHGNAPAMDARKFRRSTKRGTWLRR